MLEIALRLENVYKSFTDSFFVSKEKRRQAALIKGINFTIPKEKVTALVGDNGAGKSTLFNIISGFEDVDEGKLFLGESTNITGWTPHKISKAGIGRMFQDNHIFPELSILDNLLIADLNGFGEFPFEGLFNISKLKKAEQTKIQKAYKSLEDLFGEDSEFWKRRNECAGILSYGQQRLIGLARLLMNDYSILLLDEPSAGVHEVMVNQIILLIKRIMTLKRVTVVIIEHNIKVVEALCNYCAVLENGKIKSFDTIYN